LPDTCEEPSKEAEKEAEAEVNKAQNKSRVGSMFEMLTFDEI
jgi:hypothetical protein